MRSTLPRPALPRPLLPHPGLPRISGLAGFLLLAACATTPERPPPRPCGAAGLAGLSAGDLRARFGAPDLELRNGPGLKLQWSKGGCVLDTYLYPADGGGAERVSFAEARRPDGAPLPAEQCAALLGRR